MGPGRDDTLRLWLIHLADPLALVRRPPQPLDAVDLDRLGRLAEAHGVLPAVARNLAAHTDLPPSPAVGEALRTMAERRAAVVGLSTLLARRGDELVETLWRAGVPALIVKGAALARRAYPEPALRSFTDIDILVPRRALDTAGAVLAARGFTPTVEDYGKRSDRGERKWIAPGQTGFLVELHCDLVGSPKLRGRVSLGYDTVMEAAPVGEPTPDALMLIACVHGATGHQFDRLQHLVDIVQLARGAAGPVDAEALGRRAGRIGGLYAAKSGLDLAGRVFGEPRCLALAAALGRVRLTGLARRLITPGVVVAAQDTRRRWSSWRRKLARELIVWSR